ncbi:MAG TPA: AI-2E family transporter [Candidatus Nanoarchaeia archaeon]|nr:AI-2E family transporter [Candidatus Nanoarchaeia archaeon]
MNKPDEPQHSRKLFVWLMVFFVLLTLFLIKSMIISIIGGALLAYIFYPLYRRLNRVIRSKKLCAFLMALLLLILIMVPVVFAANAIINESLSFFQKSKNIDYSKFEDQISAFLGKEVDVNAQMKNAITSLSSTVAGWASKFVLSLPAKALSAFILLSVMYYLFMEGDSLMRRIKEDVPLKDSVKQDLISRFGEVTYATIYGLILTALIQGALGAVTFWIFDIPSPLLWGLVMVVLAMLPLVGTALVWGPAAIYKLAIGQYFDGFGILIAGIFVISSIDNIVRPKIIGDKGHVHPAMALLGVFGGLEVFGLFGIILGPLIMAIASVLVEIYLLERKKAVL